MTHENLAWLALPIALALACGGGKDHKPAYVGPGIGGAAGSSGSAGASGSSGAAGSAGSAGSAGAPIETDAGADSGTSSDAGPDTDGEVVLPDTLCPTTFTRANEESLQLSTKSEERFGSISDDELSLAFTVPDGALGTVYVTNRELTSEPFSLAEPIKGDFAFDRASLSPDGLSLLVVNADRRGFSLLERVALDKPFESVTPWQYVDIVDGLADGEQLGDPVFALGGQVLFYSQYGAGRTHTVIFANRLSTGSAFVVGGELINPELLAQGDLRRRPTAVSADYRTLFFYDEVTQVTKAGLFYGSFDFISVSDLGDARNLQPSSDCGRLYFDATGPTSDDLFVADSN
jgi:hypothetical protein